MDNLRRVAAAQGYVETLLGRKRYFPGLANQTNVNLRNREEREAINAPIQGSAADIMKIAMLQIPSALVKAGLHGRMLLQVHDELVFEVPQAEVEATAALVKEIMEKNVYPIPPFAAVGTKEDLLIAFTNYYLNKMPAMEALQKAEKDFNERNVKK